MKPETSLRLIKWIHTIVWAFFAGCILAIPLFAYVGRFDLAMALIAAVMVEVLILAANRMRCPLTGVAARFTDDRKDNFDIYLPLWIARHNKTIFRLLYVGAVMYTFVRWMDRVG